MLKFFAFVVLVYIFFNQNFSAVMAIKKEGNINKSTKKLPKSEVTVKTYLVPCSIDAGAFLKSSFVLRNKHLHNCKKKLIIKMTVNSGGQYSSKRDGFIPIDNVIDAVTGRKKRLLNPLMIRIKREKMYQLYDLQPVKIINAEAKEEVFNYENTMNFSGCDISSSHPTCGFSFIKNKIIQFSEGFCCSCDQTKNDQRQPFERRVGEKKDLPDMTQYIVRHQRSNRPCRDLETIGSSLQFKADKTTNDEGEERKGEEDVSKEKDGDHHNIAVNERNFLSKNNKLYLNSMFYDDNVTLREFHFEHTQAPHGLNSNHLYTVSNVDIDIENSEYSSNNKTDLKYSVPSNNSFSEKMLKMLMMNKIKQNKNKEKIEMSRPDDSKPNKKVRSVDNIISNEKEQFQNGYNTTLNLKVGDVDSKINIQIVTKTPKEMDVHKSFHSGNSERKDFMLTSDKSEHPAKCSFRDFLKNLTSQSLISSENSLTDFKNISPSSGETTETNNADKIKAIERVVYNVMPVINTAQLNSQEENCDKKAKVVLKDLENTTCTVLIEFEKKSYFDPPKYETDVGSDNQNNSILFGLNSKMVLNDNIPIKEFDLLMTMLPLEEKTINNPQFEVDKTVLESTTPLEGYYKPNIEKRELCDRQVRGGQSCSKDGKRIPCSANKDTYYESAHCLRFSDLWYNAHRLVNPRIENSVTVQVYAKHKTSGRKICWENLTKRLRGRVGTMNEVTADDTNNIIITYCSEDTVVYSLDCANDYLLVPQPLQGHKDNELRELSRGGPEEYLILKENEITFDGDECDKAGVSYGAFARQPHRCQNEAGTCLKNQPLNFWRDDKKAEDEGKQGQYFLKNFVAVTDQAFMQNTTSNHVLLRVPYNKCYQSHVVVELNADRMDIISVKNEGQITEVYIDATSDKVTIIKAVVTNLGIAADAFSVDFANCSFPLGPSNFNRPCKDEIPPQHRITYTATIFTLPLLQKPTECDLVLYNVDQEIVALRHIIIVRGHRCMCVWHCQCVCYDYLKRGLLCTPLSLKAYNQAGFPGQLPVKTGSDCSTLFLVLQGLLWLFIFLLLLGLMKAILGLCFSSIAVWGLRYILPDESRYHYGYMEPACYPVPYDCDGFPNYPQIYKRSVHFLPWYSEFIVNILFFICVARTWMCDRITQSASSTMFHHQQCEVMGPYPGSKRCSGPKAEQHYSPGCSSRYGATSPCESRKYRLAAGADSPFLKSGTKTPNGDCEAQQFVERLTSSVIVFRSFSHPIGGIRSTPDTLYWVRGYFMESENGFYEFSPSSPVLQFWNVDGSRMEMPVLLDSPAFHMIYKSVKEVAAAKDLSLWTNGVVINES